MLRKPEKLDRPPSYLSKKSLARELDMSEDRVTRLVEAGILPKPLVMADNVIRWNWQQIEAALSARSGERMSLGDPYLMGARNATASR